MALAMAGCTPYHEEAGVRIPPAREASAAGRSHVVSAGERPVPAPSNGFVWPVEGRVIGLFGTRRMGGVNKGVDIQAPVGSEVRAARTGRVSFTSEGMPGFGKTIVIDHGDGYASVYAYVAQILVSRGENVQQRQVIARVGSTGRTEVPALHFEIRRHQRPRNPLHYLP